jgi:DNA-binding HxlR family transcriptional regulator
MQVKSAVKPTSPIRDQCSIARAALVLGDAWMLMIIRELFWGSTRYEQLAYNTGIATNILASRLRKLQTHSVIEKQVVQGDARRFDYRLTAKGQDLFPVLMAVMGWGDAWASGDVGPLVQLRHVCGAVTAPGVVCSVCAGAINPTTVRPFIAPAYADTASENGASGRI